MAVKSKVYLTDKQKNAVHSFGEASSYIDLYVKVGPDWKPARLTQRELERALTRGRKQAKEIGKRTFW